MKKLSAWVGAISVYHGISKLKYRELPTHIDTQKQEYLTLQVLTIARFIKGIFVS